LDDQKGGPLNHFCHNWHGSSNAILFAFSGLNSRQHTIKYEKTIIAHAEKLTVSLWPKQKIIEKRLVQGLKVDEISPADPYSTTV